MNIKRRRNRPNHELILFLDGVLDRPAAADLRTALYACDAANTARITLDVARLQVRDPEGLDAIVDAYRASRIAGGQLRIERPSNALLRLLRDSGHEWLLRSDTDEGDPMTSQQYPQVAVLNAAAEGMTVIDADGEELGTVAAIAQPDPDAALTVHRELLDQYEHPALPTPGMPGGPITPVGPGAFGARIPATVGPAEPGVAPELAEQLLRTGYVKIDSKGLFHRDRYAGTEQLDHVDGDTLYLCDTKTGLTIRTANAAG